MAKVSVRQCPDCKTYNPFKNGNCSKCGRLIRREVVIKIEEELLEGSQDLSDGIEKAPGTDENPNLKNKEPGKNGKYIQICPACHEEYVLDNPEQRLQRCDSCGKTRIKFVEPLFHEDETAETEGGQTLENQKAAKQTPTGQTIEGRESAGGQSSGKQGKKPEAHPGTLILVSVPPYVGCKASFTWEQAPIVLGRDRTLAAFLDHDERVSQEHCTLYIENGAWYVKDNESTNGTLLNDYVVPVCGGLKLEKGSRLTLGNCMDSMEFEVESV